MTCIYRCQKPSCCSSATSIQQKVNTGQNYPVRSQWPVGKKNLKDSRKFSLFFVFSISFRQCYTFRGNVLTLDLLSDFCAKSRLMLWNILENKILLEVVRCHKSHKFICFFPGNNASKRAFILVQVAAMLQQKSKCQNTSTNVSYYE